MSFNRSLAIVFGLTLAAAAYVWTTSHGLPPIVASHFNASGAADGFMSRQFYIWFMIAFIAGLPLLLVLLPNLAFHHPRLRFNVPNRDYWLAPERRPETVAFLCRQNTWLSVLITGFLCYVHWLVLQANTMNPPRLSSPLFVVGLALVMILSSAWALALVLRFLKVPPGRSGSL
jgi:hypothetical protein